MCAFACIGVRRARCTSTVKPRDDERASKKGRDSCRGERGQTGRRGQMRPRWRQIVSRLGLRGGAWAQRDWAGRPRLAAGQQLIETREAMEESERLTRSLCAWADTFRRARARLADAVRVGRRLASGPSPQDGRKIRARRSANLEHVAPSAPQRCALARVCMHGTALTGFPCCCRRGTLPARNATRVTGSLAHVFTGTAFRTTDGHGLELTHVYCTTLVYCFVVKGAT